MASDSQRAVGSGKPMTNSDTEDLKSLALSVVRTQTNVFIKELLRDHNVRLGATKEDFDRNLVAAIDEGTLTRDHIETWLNAVEGWGQQHVYAYRLSPELGGSFDTADKAKKAVQGQLAKYWQRSTTAIDSAWSEDEDLHLVSITYDDSLRFHWHKGTQYWIRTKDEEKYDKPKEWIDGFEYQFRAYRGRSLREVMRFEIRPQDAMAALFIPKPIGSKDHQAAYDNAKATVGSILDFAALERDHLLVGKIIRNFDQALTFGKAGAVASSQSTRLRSGGAYVEFGALMDDGGFLDSGGVGTLRKTIRTPQDIAAFDGTTGKFRFGDLGRVELTADDNRIRLWSSLTADRVWGILRTLKGFES